MAVPGAGELTIMRSRTGRVQGGALPGLATAPLNALPDHQPVDRWQICRSSPPSHVMIENGAGRTQLGYQGAHPCQRRCRWCGLSMGSARRAVIGSFFMITRRHVQAVDIKLPATWRDNRGDKRTDDASAG
jgi:vanillate O-demethylase monooxygenase subunit